MADISVRLLAEKLKIDVKALLTKLVQAGLTKSEEDSLTESESKAFIAFLMQKDNSGSGSSSGATIAKPKKLSLKRKRSEEQLVTDSAGGKKRTVTVVRRKERVVQKKGSLLNELTAVEETPEINSDDTPEITPEIVAEANSATVADQAINIDSTTSEQQDSSSELVVEFESETETETETESNKSVVEAGDKTSKTDKKADKKKDKKLVLDDDDDDADEKVNKEKAKVAAKTKKQLKQEEEKNWSRKKVIEQLASDDDDDSGDTVVATKPTKAKPEKVKKQVVVIRDIKPEHGFNLPKQPMIHEVAVPDEITVGELAQRMAIKSGKLIKTLMQMGHMATINQTLDQDTAVLVVEELGHKARLVKENAIEEDLKSHHEKLLESAESTTRAPVVTIMGHVDHGKTSLLDYIRRSKVAAKEAGGITQHIGAYSVDAAHGKITFIDTPGHAAFSAMRARGANVTDVVVLVVAADDGVMPQTVEAIQHAKAAGVPIVVAINKIDKPEADLDRIKTELSQHEIISEEWGGEHQFVCVSAKTGQGIEELLDAILLQTEILELKAPINIPAQGVVVESRLDKGRGVVATVLVKNGTLRKGDIVLAGTEYGKVRAMVSASGARVEKAGPSDPVEILGLSAPPNAGDDVMVVETEREAREVALYRQTVIKNAKIAKQNKSSIDDLFSKAKDSNVAVLNIIIKADLQGSVEAIHTSLDKLSTDEVKVKIVGSGVGGINESDVTLAMASRAIVIGFNVRADQGARKLSESENIKIIYDSIIYNVIDDIKQILSGMLSPEIREEILGLAEVREVFRSSKIGAIAGCMVIEGAVKRNNPIRVLRDNVVIFEGELESLRRFKDEANEVKQGIECGIGVKNYNDVKVGDQIEVFKKVEVERTL